MKTISIAEAREIDRRAQEALKKNDVFSWPIKKHYNFK